MSETLVSAGAGLSASNGDGGIANCHNLLESQLAVRVGKVCRHPAPIGGAKWKSTSL